MVNDLIAQKNNLNLNLNPIYVDSNNLSVKKTASATTTTTTTNKSDIIASSSSTKQQPSIVFVSPLKSAIEIKLFEQQQQQQHQNEAHKQSNQLIAPNNCQFQTNVFAASNDHPNIGVDCTQIRAENQAEGAEEEDIEDDSPILPPPPLLNLTSSKLLNSTISKHKIFNSVDDELNGGGQSVDHLVKLNSVKNSILKSNKIVLHTNQAATNADLIDGVETITNNLNWKFFDRVSLVDDELRDQDSSGENNFDDCNAATTSSQEVLLSKSNQLQKTATAHHHHSSNSKKDHQYYNNSNTISKSPSGGDHSTIITNPHNSHHHQYNRDKTGKTAATTATTTTTTALVEIAMNSPDCSPTTSKAIVINNNYTNHKRNNLNHNNNNNSSNNNHNYHSINKNSSHSKNKNNNNNTSSPSTSLNRNSVSNLPNINNQSGGSIGNLRNDTMIGGPNTAAASGSGSQQQQQQQHQLQPPNSSSLKRKPNASGAKTKSKSSSSSAAGGGSSFIGSTTNDGCTTMGSLQNSKKIHSVFNGLPDHGIGFHLGLYGWRKKCLYMLLLILMLLIIVNLVLTLWILKVMEFSSEGMGQLKIVPGGIQLSGQALIMDLLRASVIRSKHGQPITLESSRNFSINTRDSNGVLENHLFLGHDKLECLANGFRINDTTGKNLFSVNRNEVVIGAHHLRIDGEGGVTFRESVQTPHVRAEPSRELRLESPTRQLEMTAAKDINLQSRAGGIDISALDDVKLSSIDGSIRLESSKIFLPNLKPVKLLTSGSASFHENFEKVTQLCACSNGKLFLASPKGHCSDDEGTICR